MGKQTSVRINNGYEKAYQKLILLSKAEDTSINDLINKAITEYVQGRKV
jgi:predicted HicB family RNase H-like nuclease